MEGIRTMATLRILIVVALQTIALVWMIADRQQMLNSSRVVTLKIVPVDPRDIFRGDYVILNYEISRLDVKTVEGEDKFAPGDTAYVALRQEGAHWKAASISHAPQASAQDIAVIRATVRYMDDPSDTGPVNVNLDYGIESYFVPQGTGHVIEEEARKGELSADIALDGKHRAAIKALRRNGTVFYVEGIF